MDFPIAGQNLSALQLQLTARKIRALPAGFLDKQTPGSHIPGTQFHFPEAVETTGSHIAEVQGGGAGPANGLGVESEIPEMIEIVHRAFPKVVRKASREKTLG